METRRAVEEVGLSGSRICLKPVTENHFEALYEWRNDLRDLMLWSSARAIIPKHEYWQEIKSDYSNGMIRLIIEDKESKEPIGQVFAYNHSLQNSHIFIGIYIAQNKRLAYFGVEALTIFINYLFSYLSLKKIYFEIFEFNKHSFELVSKAGFYKEGVFKEHIYYAGRFWTMYRFAMFRKDIDNMQKYLKRFASNNSSS